MGGCEVRVRVRLTNLLTQRSRTRPSINPAWISQYHPQHSYSDIAYLRRSRTRYNQRTARRSARLARM